MQRMKGHIIMAKTKSAFITIIGRPNVGKSTILNAFIGEKIAIVTNKPQTTRNKITGVLTQEETQLVFIDTPGFHKPKNKLGQSMVRTVQNSISDVDVALLVVEPNAIEHPDELSLIEKVSALDMPTVLAINKIDTVKDKGALMKRIAQMSTLYNFEAIVPVSAKTGDGMDVLLSELKSLAKESIHFFPKDTLTDQPERTLVAEMIREKMLLYLQEEIPHGVAIEVEKMSERDNKEILDIEAVIYCERETHKGIIIGKHGAMLKKISTAARAEIERFFNIQVNLRCWVKVREGWRNREGMLQDFGF